MPINAHPEYFAAEKEYLGAQTLDEKIEKLKVMISLAPKHKGAENLRAQLTTRLKKFESQKEKSSKKKSGNAGIKKGDLQVVIIGETNVGKSTLLKKLTNANPEIADYAITTKQNVIGTMKYHGTNIQIIETPSINSAYFDQGLVNTADIVLILVKDFSKIKETKSKIKKAVGEKIVIYNLWKKEDIRKLKEKLNANRIKNYLILNSKNDEDFKELQEKIFEKFSKIRIYTKEPGKEKSKKPIIMQPGSTIKDVSEKILKGFYKTIKETKIWGPSSKFPGQKVGLKHILKDLDVVEFKTR